jgi:hypothetical protein
MFVKIAAICLNGQNLGLAKGGDTGAVVFARRR